MTEKTHAESVWREIEKLKEQAKKSITRRVMRGERLTCEQTYPELPVHLGGQCLDSILGAGQLPWQVQQEAYNLLKVIQERGELVPLSPALTAGLDLRAHLQQENRGEKFDSGLDLRAHLQQENRGDKFDSGPRPAFTPTTRKQGRKFWKRASTCVQTYNKKTGEKFDSGAGLDLRAHLQENRGDKFKVFIVFSSGRLLTPITRVIVWWSGKVRHKTQAGHLVHGKIQIQVPSQRCLREPSPNSRIDLVAHQF